MADRVEEKFISGPVALVAGDSNVRRLQWIEEETVCSSAKCLPTPGARYSYDRKGFRDQLKRTLLMFSFKVLYLFIGSNDALANENVFYRNVTEVCDLVHDIARGTTIVLCEILPRATDERRNCIYPPQKVRRIQKWIKGANNILQDISNHTPYVRFMSCSNFITEKHLTLDGLHLNRQGAKICFNNILRDSKEMVPPCTKHEIEPELTTFDWPPLGNQTLHESETEFSMKYSDITKIKCPEVQLDEDEIIKKPSECRKKRIVCVPHLRPKSKRSPRKKFYIARRKWFRKKFASKISIRKDNNHSDFVVINLSRDVAVQLPASKLSGALLNHRSSCQKINIVNRATTATCSRKRKSPRKNPRLVSSYQCPDCTVVCSREDFLLDHISRRHVIFKGSITERIVGAKRKLIRLKKEQVINQDKARKLLRPSCLTHRKMDLDFDSQISLCEGNYVIFPPSVWRRLFQLMTISFLCGREGYVFVMMLLLVENNVDTNRLKLLLSNDVEQNPGPVYECRWEKCSSTSDTPPGIKLHVIEHMHREKQCKWNGCEGIVLTDFESMQKHCFNHLCNNEEYFKTVEEWFYFLPGGMLKDTTNLHLCPANFRSKLRLMFFDEDFKMSQNPYTSLDHEAYLKELSSLYPLKFEEMQMAFIEKRLAVGEEWFKHELQTKVSNTHDTEYVFIKTSRPELSSHSMSGSILKRQYLKRKHFEESSLSQVTWFDNLLKNLHKCDYAIRFQKFVSNALITNGLVMPTKQSFLKLEQEAAKLASVNKCTNGSFICSIFKCFYDNKSMLYVRYFESGVYSGLMLQKYVPLLKQQHGLSDHEIFLHHVITAEDINEMNKENSNGPFKRMRPDKLYKYSIQNIYKEAESLKTIGECEQLMLDAFVVHILPFKSKVTVDTAENSYIEFKNSPINCIKSFFRDFRMLKYEVSSIVSKDIFAEPLHVNEDLMHQSIMLNCLSGDIKRKPALFCRKSRFESNFLKYTTSATSLRNRTLALYLENDVAELLSFYKKYFSELDQSIAQNSTSNIEQSPKKYKISVTKTLKKVVVNKNDLQISPVVYPVQDHSIDIYENYCLSLLEHGNLVIQCYDELSNLLCCMNDYNDTDGSFRYNDFVYTVKQTQETGDYFYCSCKTYRTLINIKDHGNLQEFLVLDSSGENCVTCIHCRFLKEKVLPELESVNTETRFHKFVQKSLLYNGKDIVELSKTKETRKFSILTEDEDRPSFISLSFNKRHANYVVSCFNGQCLSVRGHKKSVKTLATSDLCKHLSVFRKHCEYWQDLVEAIEANPDNSYDVAHNSDINADINFNEKSGLWSFKSKSQHSPCKRDSQIYKTNVVKRDNWNGNNLNRLSDGCLNGPVLVSDIPNNTCECGSGWLKRPDEENYSKDGLTVPEKRRILTVYTLLAPVKCEVHTRLCYNSASQCKIYWEEGKQESIHVLSRDTAAGDEIGWEFVSLVLKSGCTFSAYCQLKNDAYQLRDSRATFMDSSVFINWWFSWAANMKIDFRKPCDVCGFEPKRLCCDGTKVGVGFRHAVFEEINSSDPEREIESTLHRRMDRCFLKNMNDINKQEMIRNRETLDYLARKEIGVLADKDILNHIELSGRIEMVKAVLPDEIIPSFNRFLIMQSSEKLAYAYVLKMLSTTASVTSLLPPSYCTRLQPLISDPQIDGNSFNVILSEMRSYAPELRDLICESILCNDDVIPDDIRLLVQYLINESLDLQVNEPEMANPKVGTYNPAKFGRAYYFNEFGYKLRNTRQFSIDKDHTAKRNVDFDDNALDFERCSKYYSKVQTSAPGTSNLFLWFCADHGHCYGFHMTGAEGRKDPAASLYTHLETPPSDVFYDFACNLQEYCLNRESGFYKNVRFFHDIFHSYAHKCSCAFKASRLQGFESVNSEICEQFNSFIQCIKRSARQMSQAHFCFYLQFFIHEWNEKKRSLSDKKIRVALAGIN